MSTNVVGDDDRTTATLTTVDNHYLVAGDAIVVSIGDNSFEREIKVKESIRAQDWLQAVYNKYPQMQKEFDEMTDEQIKEWVDFRETRKRP